MLMYKKEVSKVGGFFNNLFGGSEVSRDAWERTMDEREERGRDDLGRTAPDSENEDVAGSCGAGDNPSEQD